MCPSCVNANIEQLMLVEDEIAHLLAEVLFLFLKNERIPEVRDESNR